MMKSRLFLRSSVKNALNSLILISLLLLSSCSSSTTPTYIKENIDQTIQDICKKEYKLDVKAKFVGATVWVYIPLEDLVVKSDKPEKYVEKFEIPHMQDVSREGSLNFEYGIKPVPDREKTQEFKYDKSAIEKINNAWKVIRRVIFSMDRSRGNEPRFYSLIVADIKNGFETTEIFYYLDVKKVSYEYISWGEYQHRTIQDSGIGAQIIGDKEGSHIDYHDVTMKEFIIAQILHRIKLKFQKPEVDKTIDIDKEIAKIISHVVKIYDFKDFNFVELNNLVTNNRIVLNQRALWEKSKDY